MTMTMIAGLALLLGVLAAMLALTIETCRAVARERRRERLHAKRSWLHLPGSSPRA